MNDYWTNEDIKNLEQAQTFSALSAIALDVLKKMPQPVAQVCGPISTGGTGSMEQNLAVLNQTIKTTQAQGKIVFDQVPFQLAMHRIKRLIGAQSNVALLDGFYLPLFESGLIKTLYFLPNWQTSQGATWEHEQAKRLGLEIVYL